MRRTRLVGALVALAVAAIGSYYVRSRILGPVRKLDLAAREWAAGNLSERVHVRPGGELASLAETFNMMAASLASTLDQLRAADRRVAAEQHRLEVILETSPTGILVVDDRARVVLVNPAAESLLRSNPGSDLPIGEYFAPLRLFHPDGTPMSTSDFPMVRSLREGKSVFGVEMVIRRPNGWEAHVLGNSAPIRDESGTVVGAVAALFDVTPIVEEERLRTEFVLSAAHEFRNPLTVIKGYAEVAMREPSVRGTTVYHELTRILDAADRVSQLAEQLIRSAQLHLPALFLRKEVVDLASLVDDTVKRFEKASTFSTLTIVVQLSPARIEGDPQLLGEALTDLLRHAASASPVGQELAVDVSAWDGIATVSVTDRGLPIPPEQLTSLFTPFVASTRPVDLATPPRQTLLLYLARRIVEESGGWIRARSTPAGTTIVVTLPRYPSHEYPSADSTRPDARSDLATTPASSPSPITE